MKIEPYRFDDAYESIYEFKEDAYVYLTNYISAGVEPSMTYEEKRDALYQWRGAWVSNLTASPSGLAQQEQQMKHKIEDYKGKMVRVSMSSIESCYLEREMVGEYESKAMTWNDDETHLISWNCWEPLPEVKKIGVLEMMKAGCFFYDRIDGRIGLMHSAGQGGWIYKDKYKFHKDPTAPLDQWKKFADLTWDDLK